ncbi:FtsX-like permease family protein [Jiella sp. M17.18]|uniref:FtsX-like permease family protein n=1 Tax=Jiella sp. M17.18 TaxID=3234247 RepID=UPI0034E00011
MDLSRLTAIELAFAVVLLSGATGLMLFLGFAERRRTAEILAALGATARDIGGFLWSEALLVLVPGAIAGAAIGVVAAEMLVKLLSGIFDPPPDALSYPFALLLGFVAIGALATVAATWSTLARVQREASA